MSTVDNMLEVLGYAFWVLVIAGCIAHLFLR